MAHESVDLMRRCRAGDEDALGAMLSKHLGYIRACVRRRLGAALRSKGDTMDYVQEAMIRALRHGPQFVIEDDARCRALLAKIVENHLRDEFDYVSAKMRDVGREVRAGTHCVDLDDARRDAVESPSTDLARAEQQERLELAIELLDHRDRVVIRLRQSAGLSFAKIGEALEVAEDAARKRHGRAVSRVARIYDDLERGQIDQALDRTLGEPLRALIEQAVKAAGQAAIDGAAQARGAETLMHSVRLSETAERALQVVRRLAYDPDEVAFLERAAREIASARAETNAPETPNCPFVAALRAIERLRDDRAGDGNNAPLV